MSLVRSLRLVVALLFSFGAIGVAGSPQSESFEIGVGLMSEGVMIADVGQFSESPDPTDKDFESFVDLPLKDIMESLLSSSDARIEDLVVRLEEWSSVTMDFSKLDLKNMKPKDEATRVSVDLGGRQFPLTSFTGSSPLFLSIREVGGDPIHGKRISVDKVSCDLYPTVPTGDPKDRLECDSVFDVYLMADPGCYWYSSSQQDVVATSVVGFLQCGNTNPEIANQVKRVLESKLRRINVLVRNVARGTRYSMRCAEAGCGEVGRSPQELNELSSGVGSFLDERYFGVVASFDKSFDSSSPLPSGAKMILGLSRIKFKIEEGVRVSGVSYAGTVNLNIKSS